LIQLQFSLLAKNWKMWYATVMLNYAGKACDAGIL